MRRFSNRTPSVEEINVDVRNIAGALRDLPLTVTPNGVGWRIECDVCRWSSCHGLVSVAREHAETHA